MLGGPAGWVYVCSKNKHCNFLRHCNFHQCQTLHDGSTPWVLLVKPLSVTLIVFQCHIVSNSSNWKFYVLIQFSWYFVLLLITLCRPRIYHYFWVSHLFKEDTWHISSFAKEKNYVGFFSDTINPRSFKLCLTITLLGLYIFNVSLMTLGLFQGHRCVGNINCKLCFLDSCHL